MSSEVTHPDWDDWFQDTIQCPFCGEHDEESSDYPTSLNHDGDTTSVECAECSREFTVTLCVEYTFQSKP